MPEDARLPWFRFDSRFRDHGGLHRLDARLYRPFIDLLSKIHDTYPNRGEVPALHVLRGLWAMKPREVYAALASMEAAGLLVRSAGVLLLASEFQSLSGESAQATIRKRRNRSPGQAITGVSGAAQGQQVPNSPGPMVQTNDLSENSHALEEKKKNILDDSGSDLVFLESNPRVLEARIGEVGEGSLRGEEGEPTKSPEPDEFDVFTQSQPAAFALTPDLPRNGANNGDGAASLFAYWQALPHVIKHRSIEPYKSALGTLIARYGYNQARMALQRWSEISGDHERYWTPKPAWSLREVITRHKGEYVERLLSDDYRRLFAHRGEAARPSLDAHYAALLKRAGNA
jgi:hypothetical protein